MRQRGSLLIYGLVALAVMGTLSAITFGIYAKGREAGMLTVQTAWDAANRKAAAEAEKLRLARESEAKKVVAAQQETERKARDYEAKWRQARNALRDVPLAIPSCPLPTAPGAPAGDPGKPSGQLQLTYGFLRFYDGAWTGAKGESVLVDTGEPASWPEPAGAAQPVGLEGLLENFQINASRCSEDRRNYGALVDLIKKLRQN